MDKNNHIDAFDALIAKAVNDSFDREMADVPTYEELSRMFPYSDELLKRAKKRLIVRRPLTRFVKAATVALIITSLFSTVMLPNAEARSYVSRYLFTTHPDYNAYHFNIISGLPNAEKDLHDLTIGYIPEGYELTSSNEDSIKRFYDYIYDGDTDKILLIQISTPNGLSISVDNEHYTYENIHINNISADMYYDYIENSGSIIIAFNDYVIHIVGSPMEKEEIIKIAENIK